jgi:hypothetical protein
MLRLVSMLRVPLIQFPVRTAPAPGTDNYGWVWTVASNTFPPSPSTYSVVGTVTAPPPGPGCPEVTWHVAGSITQTVVPNGTGTTAISWEATNPSPNTVCAGVIPDPKIDMTGNIVNNTCNSASGTWTESFGQNGSFTMSKPSDLPDLNPSDTTTAIAWWTSDPTIALFEGSIGSSEDMAGRQVFEGPNASPSDTCWFPGSIYGSATLTGSGWFVGFYYFNNSYDYDYVGMASAEVSYYRSNGRTPCLVTLPQALRLYTYGYGYGYYQYFSDTLYINLPDLTNYGVARAGVQAWRTYP